MDFRIIEDIRNELLKDLPHLYGKTKLFRISSFYFSLISSNDRNIIEAYSLDFIEDFISELHSFLPFSISPSKTEELLLLLNSLKDVSALDQFEHFFDSKIDEIQSSLKSLYDILNGNSFQSGDNTIRFPVIEISNAQNDAYGSLESVKIKIQKTKKRDRFVFVPSDKKIEEKLLTQANISFEIALKYFLKHKKRFSAHHEILIYFDNLSAIYEGNSLGVALTIGFIEQLSILYNLSYITNIKNNIVTTGGINSNRSLLPIGREIIKKKLETVFYSDVETFVLPKDDEVDGKIFLDELKAKFPKRALNIVPVSDFKELLNRRDLVEIKKQARIIRAARFLKKNWAIASIVFFLYLIVFFVYARDFDDNPSQLDYDNNGIYVKNKSGNMLWATDSYVDSRFSDTRLGFSSLIVNRYAKIVDINNDGENEVILTNENGNMEKRGRVVCLDKNGKEIWNYVFKDTITSYLEVLEPDYYIHLIDTTTYKNQKVFVMMCNNGPSFSSAVFMLDLKTGKRLEPTLWHSGFVTYGIIKKFEDRKSPVLICIAQNNGYQQSALFAISIDSLYGCAPSTPGYMFVKRKIPGFISYMLLPNSDYNKTLSVRANCPFPLILDDKKNRELSFSVIEDPKQIWGFVNYRLSYNLHDIKVNIGSDFRPIRDSLVVKGILEYPLTDTPEYRSILKNQIQYWNGEEFVNYSLYKNHLSSSPKK